MKWYRSHLLYCLLVVAAANPPKDTPSCPDGYDFDGQQCVRFEAIPAALRCPGGFSLKKGGKDSPDECIQHLTTPPVIECPKGGSMHKGMCSEQETTPLTLTCPPGTYLQDQSCISDDSVDPEPVCPIGYTLSTTRKNTCEKQKKVLPTLFCPPQFVNVKGRCLKEVTQPPLISCPKPYELNNNKCIRSLSAKVQTFCPPGHSIQGDLCVKRDVLQIDPSCPPDTYRDPATGKCRGTDVLSEGYTCPSSDYKYEPDLDKCVQRLFADPTCPPNYTLNRQTIMCEYVRIAEPQPVCADGTPPPCARETLTSAIVICPDGYTSGPNNTCVKMISADPITSCPDGFEPVPNTVDDCERIEETDALASCPTETTKDTGDHGSLINALVNRHKPANTPPVYSYDPKGNICRALNEENPLSVCPPNYTPSGGQCDAPPVQKDADMQCPYAYQYNQRTGSCVRSDSTLPRKECPKGFEQQNGKKDDCVRMVNSDPVTNCPPGFSMGKSGSTCEATDVSTPMRVCPEDYVLSEDECTRLIVIAPPKKG